MHDVDRAITDAEDVGFVKIHVEERGDRILGATIVGRHAGEIINEITLAMVAGVGLGTLAQVIHPYPTQAAAIQQAAEAYLRTRPAPSRRARCGAAPRDDRRAPVMRAPSADIASGRRHRGGRSHL